MYEAPVCRWLLDLIAKGLWTLYLIVETKELEQVNYVGRNTIYTYSQYPDKSTNC